jgi:hypothetical protein
MPSCYDYGAFAGRVKKRSTVFFSAAHRICPAKDAVREPGHLSARFRKTKGVRAGMQSDRFEVPVTVRQGAAGNQLILKTTREASDFLLNSWPGKKSPKHRAALQACHDAQAGDKPVMAARRAFIAAAREADVLVSDKAPVA